MAISRVQVVYKAKDGTAPSSSLATASITTTTGNTIFVGLRSGGQTITGISDGTNTYTLIRRNITGDPCMEIWVAQNITGVTGAITATWNAAPVFGWVYVAEYAGIDPASAIDGDGDGHSNTAATLLATSAFSTTKAGVIFAVGSQNNFATYTAGTDFTLIEGSIHDAGSTYGGIEQYITSGALTAYVPTMNSDTSANYTMVAAGLDAAGKRFILIPN